MSPTIMPFIILGIIIVLGVISIPAFKLKHDEYQKTGKHPKGHYIGLGMAIGIALGIPLGIATDNISLGPALGLPLGLALGAAMEKKHEKELREVTPKEKKLQKLLILTALGIFIIGVAVFLLLYKSMPDNYETISTEVSSFEECVAAGNPVMESYPRKCRDGNVTYTEILFDTDEIVGTACETSSECEVPMEYMIQSNCPYQSACIENKCAVICPLWEHSPNPEESLSYQVTCEIDDECDCSEWDITNKYTCACVDGQCASIVESDSE